MFPRNPLWGNLDPSYSTDSQPCMKPDSLQQPGKEPYPKPETPVHTPFLFPKRYLHVFLPSMRVV